MRSRLLPALVIAAAAVVASGLAASAQEPKSRLNEIQKRGVLRVGMTGDYDSVIGMSKDEPIGRFLRKIPQGKFEAASGPATLCALAVETDDATGLATHVGPVRLGGALEEVRPVFWG